MKGTRLWATAILATAALGTAGEAAAGTPPAAAVPAAPARGAAAALRSPGKPRAPVEVVLEPGSTLESGVPGRLTLWVRAPAGIEAVELAVEGDAGLAVVAVAGVPVTAGSQAPGEAARFEISATPTSGGTRHLSGLVSFIVGGVPQAVPFSLPVEVAGPVTVPRPVTGKPAREPARDAAGELIDSMPAETTVR